MGNLIERLTQTELQTMSRYIDDYAGEGYGSKADIQYILREWDNAKSDYLADIFKDNFIIEKNIEYKKPISKLSDEFYDALWSRTNVIGQFRQIFDPFLWENRTALGEDYYRLKELLDQRVLAESKYNGTLFSVMSKDGHEIKVQAGCKPVKILGKVIHSYNQYINEFEEFRLECSRILNQKKLTGTLCMSIHPLDYMTMSDNNCDWSSCMSWKEEGCYRQGTVEMMNSPMVVVGYLKSDNTDMDLRLMKWNSKKWRELFIVTPNIICGVKGYPYQNEQLVDAGINMLKELVGNNLGWKYFENKEINCNDGYSINVNDTTYHFRFNTEYMYNDFGSCQHYGAVGVEAPDDVTMRINYSGRAECMYCGSLDPCFDGEGQLLCEDCYDRVTCDYCGDTVCEDDLYEVDGRRLCQYCYENHTTLDPITEEYHYDDDFHTIYLVATDGANGDFIRRHGYSLSIWDGAEESSEIDNFFSSIRKETSGWRTVKYVLPEDCTEDGLKLFEVYNDDNMEEFKEYWNKNLTEAQSNNN